MSKITECFLFILCILGIFIGGVYFGIEYHKKDKEIITSEIHLTIPKTDEHLRKQYIHALCQKTMLEELIKWNEKSKILKKKGD